jgi:hypothetical protein
MSERSRQPRAAALDAHLCGATAAAELLCRVLLETCPGEPEAKNAREYLELDGKGSGSMQLPADAPALYRAAISAHVDEDDLLATALFRG